ncbi:MAG TPA: glycosyltransferase family 2 protein [Candidatus Bathyarchaeia archaeon]|nr:glycosyltransferase family 2 protein [Candidatus Bathyarchaeia archaeon]
MAAANKKNSSALKLSVIIPVFNEEGTIKKVIEAVAGLPLEKEIIVVNDGSTDGTGRVLKQFSFQFPFRVFSHLRNKGKGAAIKTGVAVAQGKYVIVQDADLEYEPKQIITLLEVADRKGAQVVYGSRFAGQVREMSTFFRLGNLFLTALTNVLFGSRLTDMETAYKLFRRELIQSINWQSLRFDFEPEITVRILKKKIPIYEVPINYQARSFDKGKKISWYDGVRAAGLLLKLKYFSP